MVGVLVRGQQMSAVTVMVREVRLDEGVVGQDTSLAVIEELRVRPEELWLVLQEVHDLHRGALLIVVVDLRGASACLQPFVDALEQLIGIEELHADVPERSAAVREGAVAQRRSRNRRKPPVEDRVLEGKGRQ